MRKPRGRGGSRARQLINDRAGMEPRSVYIQTQSSPVLILNLEELRSASEDRAVYLVHLHRGEASLNPALIRVCLSPEESGASPQLVLVPQIPWPLPAGAATAEPTHHPVVGAQGLLPLFGIESVPRAGSLEWVRERGGTG